MCYAAGGDFIKGSFSRRKFDGYGKMKQYRYREITADMTTESRFIKDGFFDILKENGRIGQNSYNEYIGELAGIFGRLPDMADMTDEEIYSVIAECRKKFLDSGCLRFISAIKDEYYRKDAGHFAITGIDQSGILTDLCGKSKSLYFVIDDYTYLPAMLGWYKKLRERSAEIYFVIKGEGCAPSMVAKADLERCLEAAAGDISIDCQRLITDNCGCYGFDLDKLELKSGDDILVGFGEWCLSAFKKLNAEAFVCCRSEELATRALTNSTDPEELHFIYVPKGYDMLMHVSLVEKTAFNYRMLGWIYDRIGAEAYKKDINTLVREFPDVFLNINSGKFLDLECDWTGEEGGAADIYEVPQRLIKKYIKKTYSYLDIGGCVYKDRRGNDIRVNYVKLENSRDLSISVRTWDSPVNPRNYFRSSGTGDCMVSNFMFFVTAKTVELYNRLRESREREKLYRDGWHIDYKLESGAHERCETFPLYNKAAIGKRKDGGIEFFRKSLGAGKALINGVEVRWRACDVNSGAEGDVVIYTPLAGEDDSGEYSRYCKTVGKGRVNMICVNDSITCIRKGDVMLPAMGVVISFAPRKWDELFPEMECGPGGYYNIDNIRFELCLQDSGEYEWCYGGGMFLIYEGVEFDTERKLMDELACEGWLTKLSMQTQESEIHKIEKHPRTAIGLTEDRKFFMLVCSGRSIRSAGADYFDLIDIARSLFGKVEYLMNIDGGASTFLAYATRGEIFVLNDIAYSNNSCAGIIRHVNSILMIGL